MGRSHIQFAPLTTHVSRKSTGTIVCYTRTLCKLRKSRDNGQLRRWVIKELEWESELVKT